MGFYLFEASVMSIVDLQKIKDMNIQNKGKGLPRRQMT
jgi:hypothetical protein